MLLRDTGRSFKPAPAGLHQAVCVDFIDLGLLDTPWGKKPKCKIVWQIPETNPDTGERFLVSGMYTASLNEKGTLRPLLESWRGRKFTKEELAGFDTESLIGANCQLNLVHAESKKNPGSFFANVQACVPIAKTTPKLKPEGYTRMKDRGLSEQVPPTPEGTEEVPF